MINAIDEQQTIGHRIYQFLQVLRLLLSKDSHTQKYTHTQTEQTALTCSYCGGLHEVQSWHIQMKALMPLGMLTDLNKLHSLFRSALGLMH